MASNRELIELREELARCKADKEFVWSLWKQLQEDSPDKTEAISLVVAREKTKRDEDNKQLLADLKNKEAEIKALHEELDNQQDVLAEFEIVIDKLKNEKILSEERLNKQKQEDQEQLNKLSEQIINLKSNLLEKESNILSYKQELNEKLEQLKKSHGQLQMENEALTLKIEQATKKYETEIQQYKNKTQQHINYIEEQEIKHRNELKMIKNKLLADKQNEMNKLNEKFKADQKELEETREALECHHHDNELQKLLEKTEKELFEAQTELKAKNEELISLREAHDKRLERMKLLKQTHNLVLKQLKTYESSQSSQDKIDICSMNLTSRSLVNLRHENSDKVWNELAYYKAKCQELQRNKLLTEEQLDGVSSCCARYKSTISELRSCLSKKQTSLEQKKSTLEHLETQSTLEYELINNEKIKLEEENLKLKEDNKSLTVKYYKLQEEITNCQQAIQNTNRQVVSKSTLTENNKSVNKSTLTENSNVNKSTLTENSNVNKSTLTVPNTVLHYIDCSTQTDPTRSVSTETAIQVPSSLSFIDASDEPGEAQVHTSCRKIETCSIRGHVRRHSDTSLVASYQKMRKTLEKVHKLSQTVCEPDNIKRGGPLKEHQASRTDLSLSTRKLYQRDSAHVFQDPAHIWMAQSKNYQQQVKTLMRQIAVLTLSNQTLEDTLQRCQKEKCKVEKDFKQSREKISAQKTIIQDLKKDLKSLESVHSDLQSRCKELEIVEIKLTKEREKRTRFEEENKQLRENKTSLWNQIKAIQTDLVIKDKEKEALEERCRNFDSEIKRKKQILVENKKKLASLEDKTNVDKEKLKCLNDQVNTLQDSVKHYKRQISLVKSQSEHYLKEKDKVSLMLTNCQEELKKSNVKLSSAQSECQRKIQQISVLKKSEEKKEKELKKDFHLLLEELEKKAEIAEKSISNYQGFVVGLAQMLSDLQHVRQSANKKKDSVISERARKIAQKAFEFSDSEVDDFMNDTYQQDSSLLLKVNSLIQSKELPSKQKLLSEFSSYISSLV